MPTVLVGPIAGVLVDRYERWALMSVVATAQALCLLPLLAVDSAHDLWIVYVVVVVESVLGTIIEPARNAAATVLVRAEDLMAMNGLLGTTSSIARLVGGPLGGLIFGLAGLSGVIVADAATFVVAAVLLAPWPSRRREPIVADAVEPTAGNTPPAGAASLGVLRGWLEGISFVARSPMLRRLMGVVGCMAWRRAPSSCCSCSSWSATSAAAPPTSASCVASRRSAPSPPAGVLGLLIRRMTPIRLLAVSLAAFRLLSLVTWNLPLLTAIAGGS